VSRTISVHALQRSKTRRADVSNSFIFFQHRSLPRLSSHPSHTSHEAQPTTSTRSQPEPLGVQLSETQQLLRPPLPRDFFPNILPPTFLHLLTHLNLNEREPSFLPRRLVSPPFTKLQSDRSSRIVLISSTEQPPSISLPFVLSFLAGLPTSTSLRTKPQSHARLPISLLPSSKPLPPSFTHPRSKLNSRSPNSTPKRVVPELEPLRIPRPLSSLFLLLLLLRLPTSILLQPSRSNSFDLSTPSLVLQPQHSPTDLAKPILLRSRSNPPYNQHPSSPTSLSLSKHQTLLLPLAETASRPVAEGSQGADGDEEVEKWNRCDPG